MRKTSNWPVWAGSLTLINKSIAPSLFTLVCDAYPSITCFTLGTALSRQSENPVARFSQATGLAHPCAWTLVAAVQAKTVRADHRRKVVRFERAISICPGNRILSPTVKWPDLLASGDVTMR